VDLRPTGEIAKGMNPYCVCFSPDGRILAVGQNHNVLDDKVPVQLWDVRSKKLCGELWFAKREGVGKRAGRPDGVRSLSFSRDSRLLAVGTRSGWIHLWDLRTESLHHYEWQGHTDYVRGLCFVEEGTKLVSCAEDGLLRKWTVPEGGLAQSRNLTYVIEGMAISPDGLLIACGLDGPLENNHLRVYTAAGRTLRTVRWLQNKWPLAPTANSSPQHPKARRNCH
jgi:WD40 repeat protein